MAVLLLLNLLLSVLSINKLHLRLCSFWLHTKDDTKVHHNQQKTSFQFSSNTVLKEKDSNVIHYLI